MKNIKKILWAIIALTTVAFCSGMLTSCDPDDVDAFASGYRDGYYGNY